MHRAMREQPSEHLRQARHQPHAIGGNPGLVAIYITRFFRPYRVEGGWLIRMGEPEEAAGWREGRPAAREEIEEARLGPAR